MKRSVIAFVTAVVVISPMTAPVAAQGFSTSSLTPSLDFPTPNPEPVSQDKIEINE